MTLYGLIFYVLGTLIAVATALAITRRQPIHAVLYLIVAFLGTAALFLLLGAPLLAAFVVILNAGAIMVLILFGIMLFQRFPRGAWTAAGMGTCHALWVSSFSPSLLR